MATFGNITEDYSISEARSGTIRVSRLVLTGWGAAPTSSVGVKTWSDQGRMWGVFTASTNDLSLRRRGPGMYVSGDEVCSGTVSAGKVTLAADNTSGISGTADIDAGVPGTNPTADALFDVIVSYADENDLIRAGRLATSLLNSGAYPSGASNTRFEVLLIDAKRKLDQWILARHSGEVRYDDYGRPLLAHIVRPGDLARCQALIAIHMGYLGRGREFMQEAEQFLALAREEFKSLTIQFDYDRDGVADYNVRGGVVKVYRG